jgi:hypothetical protein
LSYDPLAEEQMIEHEILQTLLRTIRLADAITQSIAFELIVKFTSEVNSRAMNIFMKQNNFRVFLRLIQNPDDDTSPLRIPRCLDCILLLIHRVTYHFQGPSLLQANLQVIQPAMSLLEACVVKYEEKTKTNSSIPKDNKKSNGLRNRLVRTQERLERILR